MANAVPLLEGTNASGGYLTRDAFGPTLVNAVNRQSAVMDLSSVQRINTKREVFPVYAGRPTAAFVAEGAAKGVTGAEFTQLSVDIKKVASIVMYTQELLDDALDDPTVLVNADVRKAFTDLIDSHALGQTSAGTLTSQFNSTLNATTQTVELGNNARDDLALAVSQAIAKIEANGYTPNGVLLAFDGKAALRDAREALETATPLYTDGFAREPDTLYGLPIRYTTNLQNISVTPATGRIVAIVGDFSHSYFVVRNDVEVQATNNATVDVSGTLHHLWQQNKTAVRWEMRLGYFAHDLNRAFCAVTNAA